MFKISQIRFKTRKGAASIFIVVFSILLLSIVVLSFLRIALRGVKTSTENDLSQSAYDSALAGVEDAKRALSKYVAGCVQSGSLGPDCVNLHAAFKGGDCDVVSSTLKEEASGTNEQALKTGGATDNVNQAYTCVKIAYNTDDFLGKLETDSDVVMVPLKPFGQEASAIQINWFSEQDLSDSNASGKVIDLGFDGSFPKGDDWPSNRPPIIIAQYFKIASDLGHYDMGSAQVANRELFLVPSKIGVNEGDFVLDDRSRGEQPTPMYQVKCNSNLNTSVYACNIKLRLGESIPVGSNNHYLRLSKRYFSKASYQISMFNAAGEVVKFAGVQPAVDSNGRADNMFRRVEVRLQPSGMNNFPQPQGAVEVAKGDFCKNLIVNDQLKGPAC